jgi:predicted PurR-regulated permease PerM
MNIPIPIIVVFLTSIVAIIGFFAKVIIDNTSAIKSLQVVINQIQNNSNKDFKSCNLKHAEINKIFNDVYSRMNDMNEDMGKIKGKLNID